jgi:hypothetical protein
LIQKILFAKIQSPAKSTSWVPAYAGVTFVQRVPKVKNALPIIESDAFLSVFPVLLRKAF